MSRPLAQAAEELASLFVSYDGRPPYHLVMDRVHVLQARMCEDCRKRQREKEESCQS